MERKMRADSVLKKKKCICIGVKKKHEAKPGKTRMIKIKKTKTSTQVLLKGNYLGVCRGKVWDYTHMIVTVVMVVIRSAAVGMEYKLLPCLLLSVTHYLLR